MKKFHELRREVNSYSVKLEEFIVSSNAPPANVLEDMQDRIKAIHSEVIKMNAISEYLIIDKHIVCMCITRALLLIKILSPDLDMSQISLNILQRNLRPSISELSAKEILIEAVYLYIFKNKQMQGIVEVVRILKNKIQIKNAMVDTDSSIDIFMLSYAECVIEKRLKELLPFTSSTSSNDLIMGLNIILEVNHIKYLEDLLINNIYPSIDIRGILRQLILIETIEISKESLQVHHFMLQLLLKYIEMKKKMDFINGKYVIYEVLDDDCVGIMVRLLENESISSDIRSEIMGILVASDIQTINYRHIPIDSNNLVVFIRHVINAKDNADLLMEILDVLEIEITEDGSPAEISNIILIMDFLNITLRTYLETAGAAPADNQKAVPSIDVALEKYIGNSIMEVYNNIVLSFSNPLIIYCYLNIFSRLLRINKACILNSQYYGISCNRNNLMNYSIHTLSLALKQLSAYIVHAELVYTEMPTVKLLTLDNPYSSICVESEGTGKNVILQSVKMLFEIILQLPEPIKSTINTSYVLNIVFKVIGNDTGPISSDVLAFIKKFFTPSILAKLSNSMGTNLYSFISILINKGELDTVYNLVQSSRKLYKGILRENILAMEAISEHMHTNLLYSIISTIMVQYQTDNSALNNIVINKKIADIHNAVLNHMKKYGAMADLIKESREFGYFFKILCVIGKSLGLDCCEMLGAMLSATGDSVANTSVCQLSPLYNSSTKNVAELYYFYHFIYREVDLNAKLSLDDLEPGRDRGALCISEIYNTYSSNTLKYLALLGLEGSDLGDKNTIKLFKDLDLRFLSTHERVLFMNQIYRGVFLSGRIQTGEHFIFNPLNKMCLKALNGMTERNGYNALNNNEKRISYHGVVYKYADMSIRSAIKATQDTGIPHTLPYNVLLAGKPWLISAFLYTLYEQSPNSSTVISYIKKMKRYTKNDDSVYSRVLESVML